MVVNSAISTVPVVATLTGTIPYLTLCIKLLSIPPETQTFGT